MNIRTKLILSVGILAGMIILLVALSVESSDLDGYGAGQPCCHTRFATCFVVGFCYGWHLYPCQYCVVGMVAPFYQQTY